MNLFKELEDKEKSIKCLVNNNGCYCGKCNYRVGDNNGWTQATVNYCSSCGTPLHFFEGKEFEVIIIDDVLGNKYET